MLAKPSVKIRTTPSEVFENIAKMIHVSSIMTPRYKFLYCRPNNILADKLQEMENGRFDAIPMLEGEDLETGYIREYLYQETIKQKIKQGYRYCKDAAIEIEDEDRLPENLPLERLIARFLSRTDKLKIPYFIVNSANRIVGLITLADLDKVAVKTYLFALVSELELSSLDIVSKRYEDLKTVCKCKYCKRMRKRRLNTSKKRKSTEDKLEEYYYLYLEETRLSEDSWSDFLYKIKTRLSMSSF